jgi:UDP-N-acetylmuramate dehydrogenase
MLLDSKNLDTLQKAFGDHLQVNAPLAGYTTAHVGGKASALLIVQNTKQLVQTVQELWKMEIPFYLLGSGSNVLISDQGLGGVVIVNKTHHITFDLDSNPPTVQADSGVNLGGLSRKAALHSLSGLEWATAIPGTIGGAVYGNAGAHGSDIRANLVLAEILHPVYGVQNWKVNEFDYSYRSSILKRSQEKCIILSALMQLSLGNREEIQARMQEYSLHRRRTQPPGASMGSMFKNPPGDYAGRLIEAAGLKGYRIGGVEVSPIHANFFVNDEQATATDIWKLICFVRYTVQDRFGVDLSLEIELLGEWANSSEKISEKK